MNVHDPVSAISALTTARVSGDDETIARAAMSNFWPLLNAHTAQLVDAVSALSSRVLKRYPVLRIVHPMTEVLARSPRPFRPQMHSDDARTMLPEEIDFLLITQMIASTASGDVESACRYAKRLDDRIRDTSVAARDRLDGPLWFYHYQLGSTLLAAGDTSHALSQLSTARQLGKLSAQADAERIVLSRKALAFAARGSLDDAERALRDAGEMTEPGPAHAKFARTSAIAAAALISADRLAGDTDELLHRLDPHDALELAWPFGALARVRALLADERAEEALEAIRVAENSYPVRGGSFAFDVVSAGTVMALLAVGDVWHAERAAEDRVGAGPLTALATAHLALRSGDWRRAEAILRPLDSDHSHGPALRAESAMLSGWAEIARTGDLSPEAATRLFRIARRPDNRRLVTLMPRELVEQVGRQLGTERADQLDEATRGLVSVEMRTRPTLTDREQRVLNALVGQASTAEMAAAFHVSPNTIKSQLRSLYRKLDCSTREQAISTGARLRLLEEAGV